MGMWIIVVLAILMTVLCFILSAIEVVKDVKRWIEILRAPVEYEDEEQSEPEHPVLYLVNPTGEQKVV